MRIELIKGTLDMLVLKALMAGPAHGYAIARWLEDATDDALRVEEGSLYPALHRLERRGMVESDWGYSENNRRARYYALTRAGRKWLREERAAWGVFVAVVAKVMAAPV
ncbi:MAG TPA: PadR family transcriptional regulator [Longimicrobiales bacterium]|nr:PadR family transcriptional regulator [Longimicrobiales bacterium]